VALDLFLLAFCWELMLVPMAFLIAIWGHGDRWRAAVKFFLFTQASGLLMLLAILALVFRYAQTTGAPSFDYVDLLHAPVAGGAGMLLMLGFFVAFAVKLPVVPLHTWLPDAHTQAPTAGSVVLAGLMLKTGAYGLLRFAVPLFPEAAAHFAPVARAIGAVGVVYGGLLAYSQTDLKRLVAYTSVSHLGFVLLGVYALTGLAQRGAVVQMIAHGLSTGGLFMLVGMIQERTGTRELAQLGGLWRSAPRLGGVGLVLAMASLGLPGLANFVAEFLVLLGAWPVDPLATVIAAGGLVVAAIYALRLVQRTFHGEMVREGTVPDLNGREIAIFAVAIAILLWLGLFPQPLLDAAGTVVGHAGVAAAAGMVAGG
jgi:NADH-quinone oxidoreductase subunit M